jgi:hypothetical protein
LYAGPERKEKITANSQPTRYASPPHPPVYKGEGENGVQISRWLFSFMAKILSR